MEAKLSDMNRINQIPDEPHHDFSGCTGTRSATAIRLTGNHNWLLSRRGTHRFWIARMLNLDEPGDILATAESYIERKFGLITKRASQIVTPFWCRYTHLSRQADKDIN